MSANDPSVRFSIERGIGQILFNRPEQLNAIDFGVANDLSAALDTLLPNPDVRGIVPSGAGRAFMAGGDLATFNAADDKPETSRRLIGSVHASLERLAEAQQIVVASVHGAVAGAGFSIAAGADMAIAADDATFNLGYLKIGASPDCGSTWTLPRLVGLRRALQIAPLSETIKAEQAFEIGLVNRVVAASERESETTKLAERIASGPALAMANTKRLMRESIGRPYAEQLANEQARFSTCAGHEDFSEGVGAFLDRRKPVFAKAFRPS